MAAGHKKAARDWHHKAAASKYLIPLFYSEKARMSMEDKEIIVRQTAEIIELKDKLAEANEVKKYWFDQAQRSIPVHRLSPVEEHNMVVHLIKMGAIR